MFSFLLRVRLICAVDRSFLGGKNIKNIKNIKKNGGVAKKHVEHFSRRTFLKFFFLSSSFRSLSPSFSTLLSFSFFTWFDK